MKPKRESWQRSNKGLILRFSTRQREQAEQINNDIAEETNYNHHTKAELRMAVAYYADLLAVKSQLYGILRSDVSLARVSIFEAQRRLDSHSPKSPPNTFRKL